MLLLIVCLSGCAQPTCRLPTLRLLGLHQTTPGVADARTWSGGSREDLDGFALLARCDF